MDWSAIAFVLSTTAAVVLVASGWAKLRQPGPLSRVLRAIHIPAGPRVIRTFGAIELALGAAALAHPSPAELIAVGALYAGFAVFLSAVLAFDIEIPSCGCATEDVPPSWMHVVVDLVAAAGAFGAASMAVPPRSIIEVAWWLPGRGVGLLVGVVTLSGLAVLSATRLPTVLFAYRGRRR